MIVMVVTTGCDFMDGMSFDWSGAGESGLGDGADRPASVSGRVYESGTNNPLDNFRASMYDRSQPPSKRTDFSFTVPAGSRTLSVEKPGFERWTRKLNLEIGEARNIAVRLRRKTTTRGHDGKAGSDNPPSE